MITIFTALACLEPIKLFFFSTHFNWVPAYFDFFILKKGIESSRKPSSEHWNTKSKIVIILVYWDIDYHIVKLITG